MLEQRMASTMSLMIVGDAHRCVGCKKKAIRFRDAESATEFSLSGLCQKCQDGVFKQKENL